MSILGIFGVVYLFPNANFLEKLEQLPLTPIELIAKFDFFFLMARVNLGNLIRKYLLLQAEYIPKCCFYNSSVANWLELLAHALQVGSRAQGQFLG